MIINKILNNNVAIVLTDDGSEKIVMGRGICFKKRNGDVLEPSMIDKEFILSNDEAFQKFKEIVGDIPLEYLKLGKTIIEKGKVLLGKRLSDTIYISLIDHIYTAVERAKEGIQVRNVLLWDIKRFYKAEFEVAQQAVDYIEHTMNVALSDDEAGFIALHFVNAQLDNNKADMYQTTILMQEVTNIIKYFFNLEFDENSVYFYRFITHLQFFSIRILRGERDLNSSSDNLFEVVKAQYHNAYSCVERIADFIEEKYDYRLSNDEKLYLTIHIERVVYKNTKEEQPKTV